MVKYLQVFNQLEAAQEVEELNARCQVIESPPITCPQLTLKWIQSASTCVTSPIKELISLIVGSLHLSTPAQVAINSV